ncbi:hypothetical protein [Streptomyces sp. NPDC007346]|uniref:hypothetical protein n=1 Tax=Streptomyces sp. NPDC007346 TaxID=3154682 RepID=UPI003453D133
MAHRETTVTVHGTRRTIRTEQTGTVRQMETQHTRAVRAAIEELHAAGKVDALSAAQKGARAAVHAARNHNSGPLVTAAVDASRAVKRIETFKVNVLSFPNLKAMTRPHPAVKFDLDPTDPCLAEAHHEVIDPDALAAVEPTAEEPPARLPGQTFLDSLLARHLPTPTPKEEEPMDLETFLNDFFAPADMGDGEVMEVSEFMGLVPDEA